MKAKDYKKYRENIHPTKGVAIKCPDCGRHIGYDKDYQFMVIPEPGIVCPDCDEIVIASSTISF